MVNYFQTVVEIIWMQIIVNQQHLAHRYLIKFSFKTSNYSNEEQNIIFHYYYWDSEKDASHIFMDLTSINNPNVFIFLKVY